VEIPCGHPNMLPTTPSQRSMQKYLESLTALHSSHIQAEGSRALGRTVRREPIVTEHPLIRSNPVTGWKSLFFNPGFVTKIVGIPKVESDMIISYLNEVVTTTQEMHVRFQWGKDDVAFWDNRSTVSCFLMKYRRWVLTGIEPLSVVWICTASEACCESLLPG
jgi:alpha-ketoglutarate-dependent taurine dioxygenase